jgi:tripartite-type tricarboxylate transporter receptor subunit TctC
MIRISRRHLLGAAAFGFAGGALAQTRPIRILVGFAAGGGNDVTARLVAQKMSEGAAGQVLVDNKTGASGLIAADILARRRPTARP